MHVSNTDNNVKGYVIKVFGKEELEKCNLDGYLPRYTQLPAGMSSPVTGANFLSTHERAITHGLKRTETNQILQLQGFTVMHHTSSNKLVFDWTAGSLHSPREADGSLITRVRGAQMPYIHQQNVIALFSNLLTIPIEPSKKAILEETSRSEINPILRRGFSSAEFSAIKLVVGNYPIEGTTECTPVYSLVLPKEGRVEKLGNIRKILNECRYKEFHPNRKRETSEVNEAEHWDYTILKNSQEEPVGFEINREIFYDIHQIQEEARLSRNSSSSSVSSTSLSSVPKPSSSNLTRDLSAPSEDGFFSSSNTSNVSI